MKELSQKEKKRIAKCQVSRKAVSTWKDSWHGAQCYRCKDRFICFTHSFNPAMIALPSWIFTVPNDEEGRIFIAQARKYLNRDLVTIVLRGRAKERKKKGGCQSYQPLKTADSIAVYGKYTELARCVDKAKRQSLDKPYGVCYT